MQNEHKETANELAELNKKFDVMLNYLAEIHYLMTFRGSLSPRKYYEDFIERKSKSKNRYAQSAGLENHHADDVQSPDKTLGISQ